jgi:tetratricopeptide (TPR) repeat protein
MPTTGSSGAAPPTRKENTMTLQDRRGLAVSTRNPASLAGYEQALELTVSYFVDPLATIDAALEADPTFATGHCLRAALAVMSSERGALPILEQSVTSIETLGGQANERERMHAAAARAWLEGDFARSLRLYDDIVVEYPRDLLAVQVAHVGDFFLGQSTLLRDRIAQVLPHWNEDVPGFGYVLGMHAFGLEETADYPAAEATGRRALELNRRDPWAVHAVAHVMEMQGRLRDGIDWLSSRQADWSVDNGLAFHNWWHLGLFQLDLGDAARAVELYDTCIRPGQSSVALEMVDASAMLWRLMLRGVDVGARWQPLADSWRPLATEGFYAFNDVHAVMALVGAGRWDEVGEVLASLESAASGQGTNAMMSREVGLPVARAFAAFGRGRYEAAIDDLLQVRAHANRFGGSHAQRDIVHLTLVESALRAGRTSLARALAEERIAVKPSNPFNWRLTSRALAAAGQDDPSRQALERAASAAAAQRPARLETRSVAA